MYVFLQSAWSVLCELAPWLLVGSLVAGAMHVLLPKDFMRRQLAGSVGVLKAVVIGVPLPLCSCAVIPVGLSLRQGGASRGATVAFLISTPQTGVDSILVSASMLGWPFALFKLAAAAVMGACGGWWVDREPAMPSLDVIDREQSSTTPGNSRWRELIEHSVELLRSIWRWLVIGIIVSAAITTLVPAGSLQSFAGGNELVAMLTALAIATPLYVCATASVPIAAALVVGGLPIGAALVFLVAGPATNVATIGAVYRTLGKRALAIYLTTVIVGSLLSGWLFGFLIQQGPISDVLAHEHLSWWSVSSAIVLLVLLTWFAWDELVGRGLADKVSDHSKTDAKPSCCE